MSRAFSAFNSADRSCSAIVPVPGNHALSNACQELVDQVAHLALAEHSRLALLGFVTLPKFELGDRDGSILAIAFCLLVLGKALAQDFEGCVDDGRRACHPAPF